jgi:hypothetical protein
VVVVALLASLLVGCGGSETTVTTTAGEPLSRQEFVQQANAVCKTMNSQVKAVQTPTDLPGLASLYDQASAIASDGINKLEALTPPSDLRARYRRVLSEARRQVPLFDEVKAAAQAGDRQGILSAARRVDALTRTLNAHARALGLSVCAKNVQPSG